MKKIFTFMVVVAAAAMVSCAGNANKQAAAEAAETVETAAVESADKCSGDCDACGSCDSTQVENCCQSAATEEAAQ